MPQLVRRLALYLALAVIGLILIGAAVFVTKGMNVPSVGWLALPAFTALTFWTVIKPYRRFWKATKFRLTVLALLALHLTAFSIVLLRYPQLRLFWFMPISLGEIGGLAMVLGGLFDLSRPPHS